MTALARTYAQQKQQHRLSTLHCARVDMSAKAKQHFAKDAGVATATSRLCRVPLNTHRYVFDFVYVCVWMWVGMVMHEGRIGIHRIYTHTHERTPRAIKHKYGK